MLPRHDRLDPFPFPLLTLVLPVEAIFPSIFILENTKMLEMLEDIGRVVGAEFCWGPEVKVLAEATQPETLSRQIDQVAGAVERARGGDA